MAHHMFMESLSEENEQGSPFIDSQALPDHKMAREAPPAVVDSRLRGNPGAWMMYPDDQISELISYLANTQAQDMPTTSASAVSPHIIRALRTMGVQGNEQGAFSDPNYCVHDNQVRRIDRVKAAMNMRRWVGSAIVQRKKTSMGTYPVLSPIPNDDPMMMKFSPFPLQLELYFGGKRAMNADQAAQACQIVINQMTEGMSSKEQALMHTVLLQGYQSRGSIARMEIKSRMGKTNPPIDSNMSISDKYSMHEPEYEAAYVRFCDANENTIRDYMARCIKVGVAAHGFEGTKTEEAAAMAKLARRKAGTYGEKRAVAPGDLGLVDSLVVKSQIDWWHCNVTMWVAAYKLSVTLAASCGDMSFSDEEANEIIQYTFSRSTYRKLVASDAVMDSTRDIAASEVTQAASTPVRWARQVNPIVLVLDDAEYAITRNEANGVLTKIYDKVHAAIMKQAGKGYGDYNSTGLELVYSKETGLSADETQRGVLNPVFGYAKLANGAITVEPCKCADSNAVLMTMSEGEQKPGLSEVSIGSESVKIVKQNRGGRTLTYLMPETISGMGADRSYVYLAGMHFREDELKYSLPTLEFLSQFTTEYKPLQPSERLSKLRVLTDPTSTRVHHRHMSMLTVMATCCHAWAPCMDTVLDWPDITNTFMSALMLTMAAVPPELYVLMCEWNGWASCKSMAEYVVTAKELTTKMKALDNQVAIGDFELDLSPLFEWEVLNHRAVTKGIYDKELTERRDAMQSIKLTPEQLRPHIDSVFRDICAILDKRTKHGEKSPIFANWDDWYADRVQATPAGSAFTVEESLLQARQVLKDNGVQNLTKTQVMAQMQDGLKLDTLLSQEPAIIAQMSWKLEWSKLRALFAASMEHWMPSAFALGQIEEYLPADCPIGKAADAHRVCRRVMEMSTQGVVACIDARNFNILHTQEVMASILESASVMLGSRLSEEQHKCLKWLSKAEMNQKVLVKKGEVTEELLSAGRQEGWINQMMKGDGTMVEAATVTVGMFSGTRFTMLYNTILNRAYYKVAEELAGIKTLSLHSGDDVYSAFASYIDVYKMKKAMALIGYTLQLAKCFLQGVREFLRISHKNANTSQYLARSAATAIHGRIEADEPSDFVAFVGSIMRRGAEMVVRHATRTVLLDVMKLQIAGACARWAISAMTWDAFLVLPNIMGGCAARPRKADEWSGYSIERTASARGGIVDYLAQQPGVKTAARQLVEALGIRRYHKRVAQAVAAAIAPKGVLKNYGMIVRWMNKDDLEHLATVTGQLERIRQSREYILSKAAGLFNTLAINDHFWGDVTGVFRGIPSAWHARALTFALAKRGEEKALFDNRRFKLHTTVMGWIGVATHYSQTRHRLNLGQRPL
uniref:RNA-directed RNA polymerase n=1 Tax=Amasya cherry disease-associated mycovirus TaxID=284689 RepID=Q1HA38_9VIRU|nr:putative RNA-dependent RNA polymerase 1 [Amasya cherry disease-associated mycovirus]